MKPMLWRRLPVIRRMRFLRYDASPYDYPEHSITFNRCYHDKVLGVHARRGMRCYSWIWKTCQ